jgi:hypothetical protein
VHDEAVTGDELVDVDSGLETADAFFQWGHVAH